MQAHNTYIILTMRKIYKINILLPKSWKELDQHQAEILLGILDVIEDMPYHCLTSAMFRLTGIWLVETTKTGAILRIPSRFVSPKKTIEADFPFSMIDEMVKPLSWIFEPLKEPWRPDTLAGYRTHDTLLQDMKFGEFLRCEALFQGYLRSHNPQMLFELTKALIIDKDKISRFKIQNWMQTAILKWYVAVKDHLAKRFNNLFQPAAGDGQGTLGGNNLSIRKSVDTQLRALTKGDPLKEEAVMNLDLYRALTELDAQAAEYADIKRRMKQK